MIWSSYVIPTAAQLLLNVANDINNLRAISSFFVRPIIVTGVKVVELRRKENNHKAPTVAGAWMSMFSCKDDTECFLVCGAICLSSAAQKCWATCFLWMLRGGEIETRGGWCWLFTFAITGLYFLFPRQMMCIDQLWSNYFSLWRLYAAFACCVYVWVIHLIVHLKQNGGKKEKKGFSLSCALLVAESCSWPLYVGRLFRMW